MDYLQLQSEPWDVILKNLAINTSKSLVLLIAGWWLINRLGKITAMFFQKASVEPGVVSFLDSLLKFCLRIILITAVLGYFGLNVTSVFAALGAAFVALGISLKDNLSNVVSGIIIIINKPIRVGDYIELENTKGTVTKIEMMFTILQTSEENKTVIIPNAKLVSSNITRKSDYNIVQAELDYIISYSGVCPDLSKYLSKEFILNKHILQIPLPAIKMTDSENNKASLNILVSCQSQYCDKIKSDVHKLLLKAQSKYKMKIDGSNEAN